MAVSFSLTIVFVFISFLSGIDAAPSEFGLNDKLVGVTNQNPKQSSEYSTLPNHFSNLLAQSLNHRAEIEELTTTTLVITSDIVTSTTTIDMSTSSLLGSGTTLYPGIILSAPTISLDSTTSSNSTDANSSFDFTIHPAPSISTTNSLLPIANTSSSTTISLMSTSLPKYTGTAANITIITSTPTDVSATTTADSTTTEVLTDTTSATADVSSISVNPSTTIVAGTTTEIPTSTITSTQSGAEDFKSKEDLSMKIAVCLVLGIVINDVFALVL